MGYKRQDKIKVVQYQTMGEKDCLTRQRGGLCFWVKELVGSIYQLFHSFFPSNMANVIQEAW